MQTLVMESGVMKNTESTAKDYSMMGDSAGKQACYASLITTAVNQDTDEIKSLTFPGDNDEFEKKLCTACIDNNKSIDMKLVERDKDRFIHLSRKFADYSEMTVYNWNLTDGQICYGHDPARKKIQDLGCNVVWLDFMSNFTETNFNTIKAFMEQPLSQMVLAFTLGPHPGGGQKVLDSDPNTKIQNKARSIGWKSVKKDVHVAYKNINGVNMKFYQYMLRR